MVDIEIDGELYKFNTETHTITVKKTPGDDNHVQCSACRWVGLETQLKSVEHTQEDEHYTSGRSRDYCPKCGSLRWEYVE